MSQHKISTATAILKLTDGKGHVVGSDAHASASTARHLTSCIGAIDVGSYDGAVPYKRDACQLLEEGAWQGEVRVGESTAVALRADPGSVSNKATTIGDVIDAAVLADAFNKEQKLVVHGCQRLRKHGMPARPGRRRCRLSTGSWSLADCMYVRMFCTAQSNTQPMYKREKQECSAGACMCCRAVMMFEIHWCTGGLHK